MIIFLNGETFQALFHNRFPIKRTESRTFHRINFFLVMNVEYAFEQQVICRSNRSVQRTQAPHLAEKSNYHRLMRICDACKVPDLTPLPPESCTTDFNLAGMLPTLRKLTTKKKKFWSIIASGATVTTNGLTGQVPTLDQWRGSSQGEKAWMMTLLCL